MNAMGHTVPNVLGVKQDDLARRMHKLLPGYMAMGEHGMSDMSEMAEVMRGPANTLPMMMGKGPYGPLEMGGMFTVVKVREELANYDDPGWYRNPPGTQAKRVG